MKFNEFLNEKTFVPMTSEINEVGKYIVEALNITSQFHIFHWLSKSGQKHTALGGFYDYLGYTVDKLAEIYISIGGTLQAPENNIYVAYSDEIVRLTLQSLRDKTTSLITLLDGAQFKSLQEKLIDIQKQIDTTMYQFDLE